MTGVDAPFFDAYNNVDQHQRKRTALYIVEQTHRHRRHALPRSRGTDGDEAAEAEVEAPDMAQKTAER